MIDQPAPAAPPTKPGQLQRPDRPKVWPLAIGIVCIVIGAVGGLNYGSNALIAPFMTRFVDQAISASGQRNAALESTMAAQAAYQTINVLVQGVGLLLSIVLLVAGIGLCMRRSWAVRVCLLWSPIKMVHALLLGATTYLIMRAQFDAVAESTPSFPPQAGLALAVVSVVVSVIMTLVVMLMPVLFIVWFRLASVRAEMDGWKRGHSAFSRTQAGT